MIPLGGMVGGSRKISFSEFIKSFKKVNLRSLGPSFGCLEPLLLLLGVGKETVSGLCDESQINNMDHVIC